MKYINISSFLFLYHTQILVWQLQRTELHLCPANPALPPVFIAQGITRTIFLLLNPETQTSVFRRTAKNDFAKIWRYNVTPLLNTVKWIFIFCRIKSRFFSLTYKALQNWPLATSLTLSLTALQVILFTLARLPSCYFSNIS